MRVLSPRGRFLGTAHYSSTSQIKIRLLSRRLETLDRAFFAERFRRALAHRQRVVQNSTGYRLIHAEGDLLPGLIVDRYGDYLAVQLLTQGMDAAREEIAAALVEVVQPAGIYAKNEVAVRKLESLSQTNELLYGQLPERAEIVMNDLRFHVDLVHGQKTGVYLDQRENYLAARHWARGKALDCFTSTGGFALHMAANCESVEGVDSSEHAVESAMKNRDLNGIGNVNFREADVFHLLSGYAHSNRRFDTIVLDPPAFSKSKTNHEMALRGYKEINVKALRLLSSGGTLITCSCSHHISEADLLGTVAEAAMDAGKTLRVLDRRAQAQDHPILLTVPETLYLKCLILEVM